MSEENQPVQQAETIETPAEIPAEKPAGEPAPSEEVKPDETPAEKPPEEKESSVIRDMRRALKRQSAENAELRRMVQSAMPKEPEPVREQFADDASYIKAQVQHTIKQTMQQPVYDPVAAKLDEAQREHPDMAEKLHDIDHVQFKKDDMAQIIGAFKYGSDVLYHLATHPDEAEEIAVLPSAAFAARLGEIHSDIRREKNVPKKASSAPKPVKPVSSRGVAKVDPAKMSDQEWANWNREQKLNKIRQNMGVK